MVIRLFMRLFGRVSRIRRMVLTVCRGWCRNSGFWRMFVLRNLSKSGCGLVGLVAFVRLVRPGGLISNLGLWGY